MVRKTLIGCGILAMLWYVLINILVPMQDRSYSSISQTVSELSAIGAPTRRLWVVLCFFYSILLLAFGFGIWQSGKGKPKLKVVAVVILVDAVLGVFWPPMHQREVIAAGGSTITDTLHLVWAFVHLALMLVMIGFGAALFGRNFRIFSVIIVLIFFLFGILTTQESLGIEANLPTPHVGVWERINIAAYMLWIIVFSILLIQRKPPETV